MFRKLSGRIRAAKLSLRMKLMLSIGSIAVVLFLSSVISIMQYSKMSHYLSDLIADNIKSINTAQRIATVCDAYNLRILEVVGDESVKDLPEFDQEDFLASVNALKRSQTRRDISPLADSLLYAYSAYILTSMELNDVILSDFIDSRTWFVERLQPQFNRLQKRISILSNRIYEDLRNNAERFDNGFYRSIIPCAVAVAMGLLLLFMFFFFINVYYVKPVYRMLDELDNVLRFNRKYNYTFDGDDELARLNKGITDIVEDNRVLKQRIADMRDKISGDDTKPGNK